MSKRMPLNTLECASLIEAGEDAEALLMERCPKARKKFEKIDAALVELRAYVRKQFPEAEFYTASGGFNLLIGQAHTRDGSGTRSHSELVALCGQAPIGDGDF